MGCTFINNIYTGKELEMKEQEMIDIGNAILKMSMEEVNSLVDVMKHRRTMIHQEARLNFKVGDEVFFSGRKDKTTYGTVKKIAVKYIHVDTDEGTWRVPAANLTKPQPVE